jgi:hypothetical protein
VLYTRQAQQLESQRRRSRVSSLILWYACAIFIAVFAFAAWVSPLCSITGSTAMGTMARRLHEHTDSTAAVPRLTPCTPTPAQVTRQPPGTYSVRGHFVRVLPVFVWPPAAWIVHAAVMYLTSWKGRRDAARLQRAQERMRKMLTDLKAS